MKNKKTHPERFYYVSLICLFLLFLNFYRTDNWTGDKPFSEFVQRDWQLFAIFMIEETIIFCVMVVFWIMAQKNFKKQTELLSEKWETEKFLGIDPSDYDYVWFDFSNTERALILKQGEQFKLYLQEYDEHTQDWQSVYGVSVYDSLESLKRTLFYEYHFYCDANAESDEHGDAEFIEEIEVSITAVQCISRKKISVFTDQRGVLEVTLLNSHRRWCRKYRVRQRKPRYVCDISDVDGERRMIFYGNPRVIVVATKEQEDLWFELIENMRSVGYFAFDID